MGRPACSRLPERTRLYLLAPVIRGRKGELPQGNRRFHESAASSA